MEEIIYPFGICNGNINAGELRKSYESELKDNIREIFYYKLGWKKVLRHWEEILKGIDKKCNYLEKLFFLPLQMKKH